MKTEYQYYYKRNECPAKEATDSNCICWHDEGTGPYDNTRHDDEAPFLEWRAKPSNAKVRGPEAALSPEAPSRLPGWTTGDK